MKQTQQTDSTPLVTSQSSAPRGSAPLPPSPSSASGEYVYTPAKKPGRFFAGKQILLFLAMVTLVVAVDFALYLVFALGEASGIFDRAGKIDPVGYVQELDSQLTQTDGRWSTDNPDATAALLQEQGWWALLIDENGTVVWHENTIWADTPPEKQKASESAQSIPRQFSTTEIAVMCHDNKYADCPIFVFTSDDENLLVLGTEAGSYRIFGIKISQDLSLRLPIYAAIIILLDLAIVFLLYVSSKRTLMRNIEPVMKSLDDLVAERPVHVTFDGPLRVVGKKINSVSNTLLHKERARKNWVAGVSHDVRTPLAVIMGHAEHIAKDPILPDKTRESGALIVTQSHRIRDLIEDLNIATQLEYDMQPINVSPVKLARMAREVVADNINREQDAAFEFEIEIDPAVAHTELLGDERLLRRAMQNAINNAIKQNPAGCTITVCLQEDGTISDETESAHKSTVTQQAGTHRILLSISDNGCGCSAEVLAQLREEIASAINQSTKASRTFAKSNKNTSAAATGYNPWAHETVSPEESSFAQPKLDDTYWQTEDDSTLPKNLDGLKPHGLGIPLIARIVAAHGGTTTINSAPNEGFNVTMLWEL